MFSIFFNIKSSLFLSCCCTILLTLGCTGCTNKNKASTNADPGTAADTEYSCSSPEAVAMGSRSLGMDILNQYTGGSYASDMVALKALGGTYQTLHLAWTSIEGTGSGTTSGTFSDPSNALQTFSALANSDGIKLALTLRPIDATGLTIPSDLSSTRFNTVTMKTRFKAMIDYVITRIPSANLNEEAPQSLWL